MDEPLEEEKAFHEQVNRSDDGQTAIDEQTSVEGQTMEETIPTTDDGQTADDGQTPKKNTATRIN